MKPLTLLCFLLFLVGVIFWLAQLWFNIWSAELFVKIILTDAAALLVASVIAFLVKENKTTENLHKGSSLD